MTALCRLADLNGLLDHFQWLEVDNLLPWCHKLRCYKGNPKDWDLVLAVKVVRIAISSRQITVWVAQVNKFGAVQCQSIERVNWI